MLPPIESPDAGSSLPIIAKVSALPCDCGPGLKSCAPGASGPVSMKAVSRAEGVFRDDELTWLPSTCCSASARPPNQVPAVENTPTGSVRPAPASCDTLYTVGELKRRAARSLTPFAGFTNGSCSVSGTAIDTPPMASAEDGKISNWSAGTSGTVWIGMVCAGAVPATVSSTTERETTRLVMRHLARWGSSDTHDTPHTVRRVTGGRVNSRGCGARATELSASRIHPQQPIDRALAGPRRLERADRHEDPRQQAPVPFVHDREPGVEHREDQQRVAERRRPVLEPAHREQNTDVHHRRAHDPGEKPECLEEAVERRQPPDDRERAGDLARARIERADVDTSLCHNDTSAESPFLYIHREARIRWRTRLCRGSIEETPSRSR